MKTLYVLFALIFSVSILSAQTILWDKSIGTSDTELPSAIISTADGGFLIGGSSAADAEYEKSQNNKNCFDYWVIKVDADGKKQWDQSYSGEGDDYDGCDYLLPLFLRISMHACKIKSIFYCYILCLTLYDVTYSSLFSV